MRLPIPTLCMATALILAGEAPLVAQQSDLVSTQQRAAVVELADQLVRPRVLADMPATLVVPFNPVGFDQPDPEEVKAQQAAAAGPAAPPTPHSPQGVSGGLGPQAGKHTPTGPPLKGGEPILLFGSRRLKVGDRLTVTYEGADYDLDLTAITRTTFTLRLNREEITRPIKPGKKS